MHAPSSSSTTATGRPTLDGTTTSKGMSMGGDIFRNALVTPDTRTNHIRSRLETQRSSPGKSRRCFLPNFLLSNKLTPLARHVNESCPNYVNTARAGWSTSSPSARYPSGRGCTERRPPESAGAVRVPRSVFADATRRRPGFVDSGRGRRSGFTDAGPVHAPSSGPGGREPFSPAPSRRERRRERRRRRRRTRRGRP